jgi:hypothetical protein
VMEMKVGRPCFDSASFKHGRAADGGAWCSQSGSSGFEQLKEKEWPPGGAGARPRGCTGLEGIRAGAKGGKKVKGLQRLGQNTELGRNQG